MTMVRKSLNVRGPEPGERGTHAAVPFPLLQAISAYLEKQPFNEVAGFLAELERQSIGLILSEEDSKLALVAGEDGEVGAEEAT